MTTHEHPDTVDDGRQRPFVTVVLAVRNEEETIRETVESVLRQDYPADRFELVIADGLSTDVTPSVLQAMAREDSRIRLLCNEGKIVAKGLNQAIRTARGDIVVRLDGHTKMARDYVTACVEELQDTGAWNAGGRMVAYGSTRTGRCIARATSTPFGVGGSRFHYSEDREWVDTVYLGAWPRSVFSTVGYFDEGLTRNQDDEFNYRIRGRGGRILLSPRIKSEYRVRSSLKAFIRQYFQYGVWKVPVLRRHPERLRLRHLLPSALALAMLGLGFCAATLGGLWVAALGVLAVVYGAFLGIATVAISRGAPLGEWLTAPVVFASMHLSYGLGVLAGLVRWGSRGLVPWTK